MFFAGSRRPLRAPSYRSNPSRNRDRRAACLNTPRRTGLHAAPGQAGQSHRPQPHPQHSRHRRLHLGRRLPLAAAGHPRRRRSRNMGPAHLSPPLAAGPALLRRVPRDHHPGRSAARTLRPPRRAAPTDQRAGLGKLVRRPRQIARSHARHRHARPAALQLDRAPLAAPLLVRRLAGHAARPDGPLCRRRPLIEPLFNNFEPLSKTSPGSRRPSWKKWSPAPAPTFRPTACS